VRNNRYSDLKIVDHPKKLESLRSGNITAPVYVRVKPTNRCNMDCWWCIYSQSYRATGKDRKGIEHASAGMHKDISLADEMPFEKLCEILDDFRVMGVRAVTYSGGGEPLIYPNIAEIMRRTLFFGIDLSVLTNGLALHGDVTSVLSFAKWVRVSMDYTGPESMAQSRGIAQKAIDLILQNIKRFSEVKQPFCDLGVNFIIHKLNCNSKSIAEFTRILKDHGVNNIRFSPVWVPNLIEYHKPIEADALKAIELATALTDDNFTVHSSYDIHAPHYKAERGYSRCYYCQVVPAIGADLNVYACHHKAYDHTGLIGSIQDQRFKDMWFGEHARRFFETFNPTASCRHQCANDTKNMNIEHLRNSPLDNFP